MESKKVKEIKKALEKETKQHCTIYLENGRNCKGCEDIDLNYCNKRLAILTLTLINELERENESLKKYKCDWLNSEKMHLQADMEDTEFELLCANKVLKELIEENKKQKKRIAELENGITKFMLGCEFLPECTNEKLKQFAERLKENATVLESFIFDHRSLSFPEIKILYFDDIDKTLKEFLSK